MRHSFGPAVALCALLSCSGDDSEIARPEVSIGPHEPITLALVNPNDHDVFVDYPDLQPSFILTKGDAEQRTRRGCIPFCDDGCACTPCAAYIDRYRRIAPGETLEVEWEPIHYVVNACQGSSDCECVERWPITAGQYTVRLTGYTELVGSTVNATDPNMYEGGDPTSEKCSAIGSFTLSKGSLRVEARFVCSADQSSF